jgi:hypothetical protein
MQKYEITLPPELEAFVEEQLAGGAWGSADTLFAYSMAVVRTQFESAKSDGTAQLLAQLRQQVAVAQEKAPFDANEFMVGVSLEEPEKPVDIGDFLQKIQAEVAAKNRGK